MVFGDLTMEPWKWCKNNNIYIFLFFHWKTGNWHSIYFIHSNLLFFFITYFGWALWNRYWIDLIMFSSCIRWIRHDSSKLHIQTRARKKKENWINIFLHVVRKLHLHILYASCSLKPKKKTVFEVNWMRRRYDECDMIATKILKLQLFGKHESVKQKQSNKCIDALHFSKDDWIYSRAGIRFDDTIIIGLK